MLNKKLITEIWNSINPEHQYTEEDVQDFIDVVLPCLDTVHNGSKISLYKDVMTDELSLILTSGTNKDTLDIKSAFYLKGIMVAC